MGLAAGQDSLALLLLFAIAALELGQAQLLGGATDPWQLAGMVGSTAVLGGALYLRMLRPDTYRRRRTAIVAALRLLCAGKLLLSPGLHLFEEPQPQAGLLAAAPHFMLLLAWQSGLLLLGQVGGAGGRVGSPVPVTPNRNLPPGGRSAAAGQQAGPAPTPANAPPCWLPILAAVRLEPGAAAPAGHRGAAGGRGGCGQPQRSHVPL